MKFSSKIVLAVVLLSGIASQLSAHIYSFTNHMPDRTIQIAVQLGGVGEPWYLVGPKNYDLKDRILEPTTSTQKNTILRPQATESIRFVAGEGPSDYSRKFGFCLARIQVRYQKNDGSWSGWMQKSPLFIESEQYKTLLDAAADIASGVEGVIEKATGDIISSSIKDIADTATALGGVSVDGPLASFAKGVGAMVGYSNCRERKYEIVSDIAIDATGNMISVGQPEVTSIAE